MTLNQTFKAYLKAAYVDEPANLINYLTHLVCTTPDCPSCDGTSHWMDECSVCHGEGTIPREND